MYNRSDDDVSFTDSQGTFWTVNFEELQKWNTFRVNVYKQNTVKHSQDFDFSRLGELDRKALYADIIDQVKNIVDAQIGLTPRAVIQDFTA